MNNYRWITLVARNTNCSNLSVEEFVKMMFSDVIEAEEKYNELYVPEYVASTLRNFNSFVESHRKQATKYAEKKWKTEKYRTAYINKVVDEAKAKFNMNPYYSHIAFFDLDVHPESNGISGNCVISIDRMTFTSLARCFEEIKDNYYFKNALGWKLEYECHNDNYSVSFRPHINLILPENIQAEYEQAEKDLTAAVNEFYRGCTYWGD